MALAFHEGTDSEIMEIMTMIMGSSVAALGESAMPGGGPARATAPSFSELRCDMDRIDVIFPQAT